MSSTLLRRLAGIRVRKELETSTRAPFEEIRFISLSYDFIAILTKFAVIVITVLLTLAFSVVVFFDDS